MISHFYIIITLLSSFEVDSCRYENNSYTVSFCNKFEVSKITKNNKTFSMPYTQYLNKRYKNIFVYEKSVYEDILKNLYENCNTKRNTSCSSKYEIIKFEKLNSEKRIANVYVRIGGLNVIFGIVKTKNNSYLVYPPSEFRFKDKNYAKEFFQYIINKWKEVNEKN